MYAFVLWWIWNFPRTRVFHTTWALMWSDMAPWCTQPCSNPGCWGYLFISWTLASTFAGQFSDTVQNKILYSNQMIGYCSATYKQWWWTLPQSCLMTRLKSDETKEAAHFKVTCLKGMGMVSYSCFMLQSNTSYLSYNAFLPLLSTINNSNGRIATAFHNQQPTWENSRGLQSHPDHSNTTFDVSFEQF